MVDRCTAVIELPLCDGTESAPRVASIYVAHGKEGGIKAGRAPDATTNMLLVGAI
jgi:hypothetical protein